MAVDTRDKRMSLLGFGAPVPRMLPNSDGAFENADMAQLLYLYPGISLIGGGVVTHGQGWFIEGPPLQRKLEIRFAPQRDSMQFIRR